MQNDEVNIIVVIVVIVVIVQGVTNINFKHERIFDTNEYSYRKIFVVFVVVKVVIFVIVL